MNPSVLFSLLISSSTLSLHLDNRPSCTCLLLFSLLPDRAAGGSPCDIRTGIVIVGQQDSTVPHKPPHAVCFAEWASILRLIFTAFLCPALSLPLHSFESQNLPVTLSMYSRLSLLLPADGRFPLYHLTENPGNFRPRVGSRADCTPASSGYAHIPERR